MFNLINNTVESVIAPPAQVVNLKIGNIDWEGRAF